MARLSSSRITITSIAGKEKEEKSITIVAIIVASTFFVIPSL